MSGLAPRNGSRRGPLRALVAVACAVLVLGTASTVPAQDLNGVFRFFVEERRESGLRANGYGGTLDVRYDRFVTPTLSYLLSFRYVTEAEELVSVEDLLALDEASLETGRSWQWEPRLEIRLAPEPFEFSVGQRYQRQRDRIADEPDTIRNESNLFARFLTRLEDRPALRLDFDRRDTEVGEAPSQETWRLTGELSYDGDGWRASGGRRRTVQDTALVRRVQDEDLLSATLNRRWAEGRIALFASYALTDLRSRDEQDEEREVAVPRFVTRGLARRDITPDMDPLDPEPDLVDGDRSGASRVDIGSTGAGGQTFWNLGVELSLDDPVNLLDIWLADPIPSANAARYRWEVWRSEDNRTWTRVPGGVSSSYDVFEGRFRLRFGSVSTRYLKAVNLTVDDTLLRSVFVSELEPFGEELQGRQTERRTKTENVTSTLTWKPADSFSASLSGYRSDIRSELEGQAEGIENVTTTSGLTLNYRPSEILFGSLSALTSEREQTSLVTEVDDTYSLRVTALPVRDLDVSVVGTFRDRSRGADEARTATSLLRVATLLYRDLSASAEYSEQEEENFDSPRRNRRILRGALDARPRDEIELNSTYSSEWIETDDLITEEADQRIIQWNNRITLRPSSLLNISLEADYYHLADDEGWATVLQGDWLPFPGGALQLSVDYRDAEPLLGISRTIRQVRLRWNANRRMFLDLEAIRQRSETETGITEGRTILRAFLQGRF